MNDHNYNESSADTPEQPFSIVHISHVLLEKAWLIVICMILCLFIGLAYSSKQPKKYLSQAVLEVDPDVPHVLKFETDHTEDYNNQDVLQTIVASFQSRALLKRVAEHLSLQSNPQFTGTRNPIPMDAAIDRLLATTHVEIRKGTRLIDISAEYGNPQIARDVANALANEFIAQLIDQRAATSRLALNYLVGEAARLKAKLQHSEEALQDYREKHNSVSLEERQDTVVSKLKSESAQLTDAKAARLRLEADYNEVSKHATDVDALLAIASVAAHPAVVERKQVIANLDAKISALTLRYTEKHPKLIQARAQLADAKAALAATVLKIPSLLQSAYETALTTERNFEAALREQEAAALELNKQEIAYNVLYRDMETDRALYEAILKRLKEADIAKGIELTNIRIFEPGSLPKAPTNTSVKKVAALGLAGGFILGIGLSLLLYAMDSSIKTVDQAERSTGLSVIGAIPKGPRSLMEKNRIYLLSDPKSAISEAFRSIRTTLQITSKRKENQIFLFTSAIAAEGKTFTSTHYAIALAQQGLRTLIIDADLRAPRLSHLLLGEHRSPGLTDFITDPAERDIEFHKGKIDNLYVLPAGSPVINPAELLSSPRLATLLAKAAREFDAVVVDTAPIQAVSDTLLLVEYADWVCLVAKAASTPERAILRARLQLEQAGGNIAGLILNQLPSHGGIAYYYYYGNGRYGSEGYTKPTVPLANS